MLKKRRSTAAPLKQNLRADIQGLRALAVVAVIADHMFHWPTGGFVGVDIFFVISGFLITGLLLREHERTGRISFLGFYRRRTQRILPAAFVVLVVTSIAAFVMFNAARASSVVHDAIWALFFSANWRFAIQGTDYFQATGPVSPLQHFWSLAVEEQFYFIWPWLMVLSFAILGVAKSGDARKGRVAVGVVMGAIVAASFFWSLGESADSPTMAYFSTFSRAWELGVGALLAVGAGLLNRIPAGVRSRLSWVGLAGIAASLFLINDSMAFPGPWAALPVFSTAVVIAAGTGGAVRVPVLTNPVSRYLGDVSYSLYLWHFPVIILADVFLEPGLLFFLTCLLLTGVFSTGSYHLVEQPFQKAPFLHRYRHKSDRQRAVEKWWKQYSGRYQYGALGMLLITAIAVSGMALMRSAPSAPTAAPVQPLVAQTPSPAETANPFGQVGQRLSQEIGGALAATVWPELNPSLDDVLGKPQTPADVGRCQGAMPPPESACTWGLATAPKTIVLVGDSTSSAYTKAFQDIIASKPDWKPIKKSMGGCRFVDLAFQNDVASIVEACPGRIEAAIDTINNIRPELVVITNGYKGTIRETGKPVTSAEWNAALTRTLTKFAASAGKVVFLAPPPSGANIEDCYDRFSSPNDCLTTVESAWSSFVAAEQSAAKQFKAEVIDTRPLFCQANRCPAFVGTTPVKVDHVHLTQAYVEKIAPAIDAALHGVGAFGS
ncbi:acyltransferase family protein [Pseudarthrobacter sp. NPDC058329]|uniref:acyltransferase family protein n=1 Tax=Pseudarthrobacter sp. NPDC058329 TaxID=3346448 RepID=UPI0036D9D2CC